MPLIKINNLLLGKLIKALLVIAGMLTLALLGYDFIAVRPHLAQVENTLKNANPQDATPPEIIRKLIDSNASSPIPYTIRLVLIKIHPNLHGIQWHLHNTLWQILLPIHLGHDKMYGLYATLAYNGTDYALSSFAIREYHKPLNQLLPEQAAITVEITRCPSCYLQDRAKLNQRALILDIFHKSIEYSLRD